MADKKELADMLSRNEELLSRLYKIYSQKIPAYSDFWLRLSDDERMHAQKIREFYNNNDIKINISFIKKTDLLSFAKEAEGAIKKAEGGDVDFLEALEKALALEKKLSEKKFFEAFVSDSSEANFYLNEIAESIEKHRQRIEKMIDKSK